jgi:hypothetical protein
MAAVARSDNPEDLLAGAAMAGIAETDADGRFTLENIPPGRYLIAAGRLDQQTYYPGTQQPATATVVTIAAGAAISGVNFTLNDASFGRAPSIGGLAALPPRITATIPVHVTVENKGRVPISADGNFVSIHLDSIGSNSIMIPINASAFEVPGPAAGDYRVRIESLPRQYVVKSITYGPADITKGAFRLTAANFIAINTIVLSTLQSVPAPTATGAAAPPSTISITLALAPPAQQAGVRVAGRIRSSGRHLITMSGRPGVVFSDGTFEFRGVPPGLHLIATVSNPAKPLANVVVVGDRDLDSIELTEAPLLPEDVRTPKDPRPAGAHNPGSMVPFARLTGMVLEEVTRVPIGEGTVIIRSDGASRSLPIAGDGRFGPFPLLPGTYDLHLEVFGHTNSSRILTVDDKDLSLELTTRRLY